MAPRGLLISLALVGLACGLILAFVGQSTGVRACGVLLAVTNSYLALRYYQRQG